MRRVRCNVWLGVFPSKKLAHGLDRTRAATVVNYRVAVRKNREKVFDGVDFVLSTDLREGHKVMNVNKAREFLAVYFAEVEPADDALRSMMLDASKASIRASFERVDCNGTTGAFPKRGWNFLRKGGRGVVNFQCYDPEPETLKLRPNGMFTAGEFPSRK